MNLYLFHSSCVTNTSGGGNLIVGVTSSPISGDKSEVSKGSFDYWAVKIDANGNKVWDKTFGGSGNDQIPTVTNSEDDGFLIAGYSNSPISGDKSENSKGGADYWAVRIDANGNKVWDKTLGGSGGDGFPTLTNTPGGGYLIVGYSSSAISGDKSEVSKGSFDYWAVKIDANGNKIWDKTFGGSGNDQNPTVTNSEDGGYLIAGYSSSQISGDKSENSEGGNDIWAVKISADGEIKSPLFAVDGDGDVLTWSLLTAPSNGVANVAGTGPYPTTLSYTPNENFHGTDSFVIQVSDGNLTASATVNVQVTPVHDPLTGFISDNNLTMVENLDIGTVIGQIIASNPDDGNLFYKLVDENGSTNNHLFTLEQNGTLKTAVLFDYETNASTYQIRVQAKDELNATIEKDFTLTLKDINELPVIHFQNTEKIDPNGKYHVEVPENQIPIMEFNATDPEGETITFSIHSGLDAHFFDINATSGFLSFKSARDYEIAEDNRSLNIYDLKIQLSDGTNQLIQSIAVWITDVDDTPPIITLLGDTNSTHEAGSVYTDAGAQWNDSVDGNGTADANGYGGFTSAWYLSNTLHLYRQQWKRSRACHHGRFRWSIPPHR